MNEIRRTRILFIAWGYSIHAKRRISIFTENEGFDVSIASTHDYEFENARNVLLSATHNKLARQTRTALGWLRLDIFMDILLALIDYLTLRREFNRCRPDVIFLQTLLYPCYLSYLLPRGVPTVITFWNGDLTWWAKWNGIERAFKKWLVTFGIRRARAITVNSRAAYEASLNYGIDPARVHIIRYPGVDLERFSPMPKAPARAALGISAPNVVLCPRGLGQYLNSDVLIEAAFDVVKKYPGTLFIFLSNNEEELIKHRQMASSLGIADNIRWEGNVPWERMPQFYAASDMMVSNSSNDSLPNCMLEAMACGRPVIMGDIPPIREWVKHNVNGLMVGPRDKNSIAQGIISIIEDKDGMTGRFTKRNLDLALERIDSKKNIKLIKTLIIEAADSIRSGQTTYGDDEGGTDNV